ncbi:ATP-dependent DNA ligase [Argonema antarcticum]|uniref:ATP-dependent DNA ligase n=1 Tax=Argonema antarcticum TaxID=2942763 RepID=UPI0020123D49|nr:ATP-dependent DNA ligase [Argonema antarcticum]MCL1474402.1 ATP-dependent DNA ligase [Argonema antarcticum A004/B2]
MNITEYIESKRNAKKKIPSEIRERWNNRILKRELQAMGEAGAIQYLADYGRGIAVPKVVHLALCAESEGYPLMAQGFWRKAFEMETGNKPPLATEIRGEQKAQLPQDLEDLQAIPDSTPTRSKTVVNTPVVPELPPHLQPGRIVTMQPVDAPFDRTYYINDPRYWGQPKRDGNRVVVVATSDRIYYQSRSTNMRQQPSIEINQALLDVANKKGTFILDGELYYRSVTGSEHRTGAQAATVNINQGSPTTQPIAVYAIFKALLFEGRDLTIISEAERIEAAERIREYLPAIEAFEIVPTARTFEEKRLLAQTQESFEREGEVWVQHDCTYVGGKDTRTFPMVRTKYCLELDLVITELTLTKVVGRPFSAIMVAQDIEGKLVPMGSVGTGFSQEDMQEIARRHAANPGKVKIVVRSQGLTENGKLWHGRFVGFCEEI